MNWIKGSDRSESRLLPPTIDEYVGEDNVVRFVDLFVGGLDLKAAGFEFPKADPQGRGRPAYPPAVLLKLYLYGYLQQLRSSRRLEVECQRNLEVIWLLGELKPDFKTIANFRKDNAPAFKAVLREFTELCRKLKLFGGELLAIDGTKIKGSNARDRNWSRKKLEQQEAKLKARVEEYLQALDQADAQDQPGREGQGRELRRKLEQLKQRQARIQGRLQVLAETGESQLSVSDPDSRGMKGPQGHLVGYNVQGAVDARHHLLVHTEVTNSPTDQGLLATTALGAKAVLGLERAEVVADGGYYRSQDIKECQDQGLEPHLPEVENSPSERAGLFGKKDFKYQAGRNVYDCPGGAQLHLRRTTEDKGRKLYNYDNPKVCAACPLKARCTPGEYRTISRWEHEERLERMTAAVAAAPEKLAARKTLIEHCWGTLKWLLPGGFLVRGQDKVGAEVALAHLAYNLKRALAVLGMAKLMAALGGHQPSRAAKRLQRAISTLISALVEIISVFQPIPLRLSCRTPTLA